MRTISTVSAAILLTAACGGHSLGPPLDSLPRQLTQQEVEVRDASNTFAFELLREIASHEGDANNVIVSPLSVSMALGMAANGAAGLTLDSIQEALGLAHQTPAQFNEGYKGLLELLRSLDNRVQLDVANSAWSRSGFEMLATFVDALEHYFEAEARALDFDDPAAKDVINAWVADRTNDRIEEIVQEITPDDMLFLINAVYFLGDWRSAFDPDETVTQDFYLTGGSTTQVQLMTEEDMPLRFGFDSGSDVVVGELPYGADAFSMVLVVPQLGELGALVESLTPAVWDRWISNLRSDTLAVRLPTFELEYETELSDVLEAMGMGIAFDPMRADFTALSPVADLHITRVRHKTYLRVDEEGTEAAAATSVGIGTTSVAASLTVDRPFLLAIRERLSGTLLFVGAVYDPS